MPPFLPRKRGLSEDRFPNKRQAFEPEDIGSSTRKDANGTATELLDDDSESDLSSLPSGNADKNNGYNSDNNDDDDDDDDDDDEEEDWEDAFQGATLTSAPTPATPASSTAPRDLELTLDKNHAIFIDPEAPGKKGPSRIERQIRIQTHCMHVQFLLFHNALRNWWINDAELHQILRDQLPPAIKNEIKKWEIAAGIQHPDLPTKIGKGKGKYNNQNNKRQRDWGEDASRLEAGRPDMSRGDPTIHILRVLAAYWRKRFSITAPGLRKNGYRPTAMLQEETSSFHKGDHGKYDHGERIRGLGEFRDLARRSEGSRDVGAQLFTALLRALGMEARMVASLQPLGFGWTKVENYRLKDQEVETATVTGDGAEVPSPSEALSSDEGSITDDPSSKPNKRRPKNKHNPVTNRKFDSDLPFPIYWTEAVSPITHEIIPVETLILPSSNAVATTPELLSSFEPRGGKAEKAKQVIAYVVAYSPDATAKDVTTRYLKRHTWPGKSKGFRMPVEKIPMHGGRGPARYFVYDWFKATMRGYVRPEDKRTIVDEKEDSKDLVANQPEKKLQKKEGDTLQSLRNSTEFVLERFLRREEAIRPGAQHVRTFTSGKGDKMKKEKIYKRSDVEKCLSAESWHKEGRQIKIGEAPLKFVPIRAVTLTRKREVEVAERESGEKQKQGLYALYQTEYIIPPPIKDGKIPKNAYGNIDCFVPSMIPKGATHIPLRGTVRICKKLGVDYAEAVTGFEFGSKMAVPVIEGVVVASENAGLVKDAWLAEDAERRKREQLKHDKLILSMWRKFIMGLRIAERIQAEYGSGGDGEERNPFSNRRCDRDIPPTEDGFEREKMRGEPVDEGGGFLLPGEDESVHRKDIVDEMEGGSQSRMAKDMGDENDGRIDIESSSELSDALSVVSVHSTP
ncbi:Rad4 family protein [Histoplasma capsulatum H143]|uniref:Rad4 family protein n=1 Tax=Ajellomyces capsulatus (strain H143) TaxID=544712 RepID=C6H3E4_AJECH|nr:Rad4 family protein [Histoplasma capsulatum H143]